MRDQSPFRQVPQAAVPLDRPSLPAPKHRLVIRGRQECERISCNSHLSCGLRFDNRKDALGLRASGLGEVVVVEGGGVRAACEGGLVHDAVNLVRGDAGSDGRGSRVQDLPSQLRTHHTVSAAAVGQCQPTQ